MATQVTLRNNKGATLSHTELDNNFSSFMTLSGAGASRDLVGIGLPILSADPSVGTSTGVLYFNGTSLAVKISNNGVFSNLVSSDPVTKTIALLGI